MSYEVNWLQENHVINLHLMGDLTIEDIIQLDGDLINYIRQGAGVTPLVHVIVDVGDLKKFPVNLGQVKSAIHNVKEPGLGWTIIVGAGSVVKFFASVITQIAKARFRSVNTLEEALDFLAEQDIKVKRSA